MEPLIKAYMLIVLPKLVRWLQNADLGVLGLTKCSENLMESEMTNGQLVSNDMAWCWIWCDGSLGNSSKCVAEGLGSQVEQRLNKDFNLQGVVNATHVAAWRNESQSMKWWIPSRGRGKRVPSSSVRGLGRSLSTSTASSGVHLARMACISRWAAILPANFSAVRKI